MELTPRVLVLVLLLVLVCVYVYVFVRAQPRPCERTKYTEFSILSPLMTSPRFSTLCTTLSGLQYGSV